MSSNYAGKPEGVKDMELAVFCRTLVRSILWSTIVGMQ